MDQIPEFETVGQRLEWWIARRNRRQTELAKAVGMAQSALSEIVAGRSKRPAADNMLRLARELQLRPEYLTWGDGPPEATNFSQLSGLEAQLVMLFRGLPDDAERDALLIDVNDFANRHKLKAGTSVTDTYPDARPPGSTKQQPATVAGKTVSHKRLNGRDPRPALPGGGHHRRRYPERPVRRAWGLPTDHHPHQRHRCAREAPTLRRGIASALGRPVLKTWARITPKDTDRYGRTVGDVECRRLDARGVGLLDQAQANCLGSSSVGLLRRWRPCSGSRTAAPN